MILWWCVGRRVFFRRQQKGVPVVPVRQIAGVERLRGFFDGHVQLDQFVKGVAVGSGLVTPLGRRALHWSTVVNVLPRPVPGAHVNFVRGF